MIPSGLEAPIGPLTTKDAKSSSTLISTHLLAMTSQIGFEHTPMRQYTPEPRQKALPKKTSSLTRKPSRFQEDLESQSIQLPPVCFLDRVSFEKCDQRIGSCLQHPKGPESSVSARSDLAPIIASHQEHELNPHAASTWVCLAKKMKGWAVSAVHDIETRIEKRAKKTRDGRRVTHAGNQDQGVSLRPSRSSARKWDRSAKRDSGIAIRSLEGSSVFIVTHASSPQSFSPTIGSNTPTTASFPSVAVTGSTSGNSTLLPEINANIDEVRFSLWFPKFEASHAESEESEAWWTPAGSRWATTQDFRHDFSAHICTR